MPLLDFKSSERFAFGIKLEPQLANQTSYHLLKDSSALIAAVTDDITESMCEIATGVCDYERYNVT